MSTTITAGTIQLITIRATRHNPVNVSSQRTRGIELRTLVEVDRSIALNWISPLFVHSMDYRVSWDNTILRLRDSMHRANDEPVVPSDDITRIDFPFLIARDGTRHSLYDAHLSDAIIKLVERFPGGLDE